MAKGLTGLVVVAALVVTGCGGDSNSAGGGGGESQVKVGLALPIGGRGDQSFSDSAIAGLDKASKQMGVTYKELAEAPGDTDAQRQERLISLAEAGFDPVIAVGFTYAPALGKVAPQFPETSFAIVDDSSLSETNENVTSLVFAEHEGSYLVGAIAAQASKHGNIGFVGGVNVPLIQKFEAGYVAGAKAVRPDTEVQVKYLTEPPDFSGFADAAKGKIAADGMFQSGADVVYHAAGGSGGGVFRAAKAANAFAIGVDSDQYASAPADVKESILTSMLKRVDVAVFDYIRAHVDGSPLVGVNTFDLAKNGVGYSKSNDLVQPYVRKTDQLRNRIVDGEITVPAEP